MPMGWILGAGCAIAVALLLMGIIWSRRPSRARGPATPGRNRRRPKEVDTHRKFTNLGAE